MKKTVLKMALLAILLVLPTASRLKAGSEPAPASKAKKEKRIVVASPEKEIVVDGDNVFVWGDDEDSDTIADLQDMEGELPEMIRFHERSGGGYIGVRPIEMTPELREHFGASKEAGILAGRVEPESPAAKAGLRVGDIVTAVDSDKIESTRDLMRAVRRKKDGETVKLDVLRDRAVKTVSVTVVERKGKETLLGDFDPGKRHFHFRHMAPPVPPVPPVPPTPAIAPLPPRDYGDMRSRLDQLEQRLKELEGRLPSP